jgi:hypothetical protein
MKWSLALILCCWSFLAEAQSRFHYSLAWKNGKIVLESGDTVRCMVRYNTSLPEGIVQVQDGENTLSLSVKDLLAFQFHDDSRNRDRVFERVVLADGEHDEGQPYFCEVLYRNATFSILKHRAVGVPYEHMNYTRFIRKHAVITERFIVHQPSGKMLSLSRENALRLMENKLPEINSFIEENSIRFKSVTDYIRVLNFHAGL